MISKIKYWYLKRIWYPIWAWWKCRIVKTTWSAPSPEEQKALSEMREQLRQVEYNHLIDLPKDKLN